MTEIDKAILLLIANGYGVFRLPSDMLPKVTPPNEEEAEELALGQKNYTVSEFCMLYGIGRTFFYELLKQHKGPGIMKIGRKTLIPRACAEAWQAQMEAERG